MRFCFSALLAFDPGGAQDALNAFCAQQRIVASDRHFLDRGSYACCAVGRGTTTARTAALPTATGTSRATATPTLASALPQLKSRRLRL